MTITDSHTHHLDRQEAVISVAPNDFAPRAGLLYSVGIHPWQSGRDDAFGQLPALAVAARHPQVVAIGETGLDSLRGAPLPVQEQLMCEHIKTAIATGMPLVIHCVRTSQQVIKLLKEIPIESRPRAMVHDFRGNPRVLRQLLDAGLWISYGARFNPASLQATPAERLLIETDDAPQSINQVAAQVAGALGHDVDAVLALATHNAACFYAKAKQAEHQ